jgi:hypothetical protein
MTKTLNQIIFFPPPNSEYFFQQHWESEYVLRKKNITPHPPFKLNGRLETNPDHDDIIVKIKIFTTSFNDQYFAHWRCLSNYIL